VEDEDAHILHANEKYLQLFRHQPGQLKSNRNKDLMLVDKERERIQQELDKKEILYYKMNPGAKMQKYVEKKMRDAQRKRTKSIEEEETDKENDGLMPKNKIVKSNSGA
jgi:hypothetical protein